MNQVLKQFRVTVTLDGEKREFNTRALSQELCVEEVKKAFEKYKPTLVEAKPLR